MVHLFIGSGIRLGLSLIAGSVVLGRKLFTIGCAASLTGLGSLSGSLGPIVTGCKSGIGKSVKISASVITVCSLCAVLGTGCITIVNIVRE